MFATVDFAAFAQFPGCIPEAVWSESTSESDAESESSELQRLGELHCWSHDTGNMELII